MCLSLLLHLCKKRESLFLSSSPKKEREREREDFVGNKTQHTPKEEEDDDDFEDATFFFCI